MTAVALGATPASAAAAAATSGGFANANGIIVNLTVLTAVPLPGALGNTPLNPNTFSNASQSCPPTTAKPATGTFPGDVNASPAATAKTLNTSAMSRCSTSSAVASAAAQTEGVTALVNAGVPTITADVIKAQANSDCTKAPNATGSVFQNLKIAGTTVLPDPAPNTVISIPGVATVIVNEQHPTAAGRGIVVNGLHVIGASPLLRGDLIISHAVSGVVCPNGKTSDFSGVPGAKPQITFSKNATPSTAKAGDTVTYNTTVTNTSAQSCDVIRFVDHLDPAFDFVSTKTAFGTTANTAKRSDGGTDVILNPTGLTIASGKSLMQTFVVKLKGTVAPGTYYNNLELFCAVNGDFASGPLAPVTVPAPAAPSAPPVPVAAAPPAPAAARPALPSTGAAPVVAVAGFLLLAGAAAGVRRTVTR